MGINISYLLLTLSLVSVTSLMGWGIQRFKVDNLWILAFTLGVYLGNTFGIVIPEIYLHTNIRFEQFCLYFGIGFIILLLLDKILILTKKKSISNSKLNDRSMIFVLSDSLHYLIDGILITTAFLIDIRLGISTAIPLFCHEVPRGLTRFNIFIHLGEKPGRAGLYCVLSILPLWLGALMAITLEKTHFIQHEIILSIISGSFCYIIIFLFQRLFQQLRLYSPRISVKYLHSFLIAICVGLLMWGISKFEEHSHVQKDSSHNHNHTSSR